MSKVDARTAQRDAQLAIAEDRGETTARARPALGFSLDRTCIADLEAWAGAHRLRCESK